MSSFFSDRIAGVVSSLAIKTPVVAATTANITLSGEQTIDGVSVVSGDRVLVKNQTVGADNGIWVASTSSWSRAADFNGVRDVTTGTQVYVIGGTANGTLLYFLTTTSPVIGTSSLVFESLAGAPAAAASAAAALASESAAAASAAAALVSENAAAAYAAATIFTQSSVAYTASPHTTKHIGVSVDESGSNPRVKFMRSRFECVVADGTFDVEDVVEFMGTVYGGAANTGISHYYEESTGSYHARIGTAGLPPVIGKAATGAGGASQNLDLTKWDWYFTIYLGPGTDVGPDTP